MLHVRVNETESTKIKDCIFTSLENRDEPGCWIHNTLYTM